MIRNTQGQFVKGFVSPRRNGEWLSCETCSSSFYVPKWRVTKARWCSRKCFRPTQVAKERLRQLRLGQPSWNKGLIGFRAEAKSHLWTGGKTDTTCKCCQKKFQFWPGANQGMFCSKKCSNTANARIGADNNMWKGGITSENRKIRTSTPYKEWRVAVFQRDDYTCQECDSRGAELHADHIKRFADYPELRFELSNGRTLCVGCHRKTPTYGWTRKLAA